MKLANQDKVQALDAEFGRMAAEVGMHAWSLPQLTMREKAFVFLAADLCTANPGFPLLTHVEMASANGVSAEECISAIRHLAPYVGYPTAAVALQQLRQLEPAGDADPQLNDGVQLPAAVLNTLTQMDREFAEFFADQFNQRWGSAELSPRERALACVAADVANQTLDESFALHVDLARENGAADDQVRGVLLLVAEYGIAKAWRAYRVLTAR
jgi:4-carboxymuconolactone decarboxylase